MDNMYLKVRFYMYVFETSKADSINGIYDYQYLNIGIYDYQYLNIVSSFMAFIKL